jgi:hypothetical protein
MEKVKIKEYKVNAKIDKLLWELLLKVGLKFELLMFCLSY